MLFEHLDRIAGGREDGLSSPDFATRLKIVNELGVHATVTKSLSFASWELPPSGGADHDMTIWIEPDFWNDAEPISDQAERAENFQRQEFLAMSDCHAPSTPPGWRCSGAAPKLIVWHQLCRND